MQSVICQKCGPDNQPQVFVKSVGVTPRPAQKAINQFLGISQVEPCCDLNGNGLVTIDEVQKVINSFLGII